MSTQCDIAINQVSPLCQGICVYGTSNPKPNLDNITVYLENAPQYYYPITQADAKHPFPHWPHHFFYSFSGPLIKWHNFIYVSISFNYFALTLSPQIFAHFSKLSVVYAIWFAIAHACDKSNWSQIDLQKIVFFCRLTGQLVFMARATYSISINLQFNLICIFVVSLDFFLLLFGQPYLGDQIWHRKSFEKLKF